MLANNSSTAAAVSDQLADVSSPRPVRPTVLAGQRIAWTITVGQRRAVGRRGVVVTDALPAGVADVQVHDRRPASDVHVDGADQLHPVRPLADGDSVVDQVSALVPSGRR